MHRHLLFCRLLHPSLHLLQLESFLSPVRTHLSTKYSSHKGIPIPQHFLFQILKTSSKCILNNVGANEHPCLKPLYTINSCEAVLLTLSMQVLQPSDNLVIAQTNPQNVQAKSVTALPPLNDGRHPSKILACDY